MAGRAVTLVRPLRGRTLPREAEDVDNATDPRGQFAAFLRDWVARKASADDTTKSAVLESIADSIGIQLRAVQKWTKGKSGPNFGDLGTVARTLGFRSWDDMAVAIVKHSKRRRK